MKHSIQHFVNVDGIIYKTVDPGDVEKAVDFFFDVYLKGRLG
jgi:hypothetical protein